MYLLYAGKLVYVSYVLRLLHAVYACNVLIFYGKVVNI